MVQKELDDLKGKADIWLSELTRINSEMTSKLLSLQSSFAADIHHMPTYTLIQYLSCFSSEDFPHSDPAAKMVVTKSRQRRAESGPINSD